MRKINGMTPMEWWASDEYKRGEMKKTINEHKSNILGNKRQIEWWESEIERIKKELKKFD